MAASAVAYAVAQDRFCPWSTSISPLHLGEGRVRAVPPGFTAPLPRFAVCGTRPEGSRPASRFLAIRLRTAAAECGGLAGHAWSRVLMSHAQRPWRTPFPPGTIAGHVCQSLAFLSVARPGGGDPVRISEVPDCRRSGATPRWCRCLCPGGLEDLTIQLSSTTKW